MKPKVVTARAAMRASIEHLEHSLHWAKVRVGLTAPGVTPTGAPPTMELKTAVERLNSVVDKRAVPPEHQLRSWVAQMRAVTTNTNKVIAQASDRTTNRFRRAGR